MSTDRETIEWNKGAQSTTSEYVSIYQTGAISLPKSVYNQHFAGEDGVILKYSTNTDEIGITPASRDHANSYAISGQSRQISCKPFLEEFGILRDETYRLPISDVDGTIWVQTDADDNGGDGDDN